MATNSNLVAHKAASLPARIPAGVPSHRRNSSVKRYQPATALRGSTVSASSAQADEKQPKKNVLFSLLFVSMIGAIAFIPSVWTLFGIAALLVFAFVASNKENRIQQNTEREAQRKAEQAQHAERESDRIRRKEAYELQRAEREAEREARALIRDLRVKAAQADAYAAFVRAQRASARR